MSSSSLFGFAEWVFRYRLSHYKQHIFVDVHYGLNYNEIETVSIPNSTEKHFFDIFRWSVCEIVKEWISLSTRSILDVRLSLNLYRLWLDDHTLVYCKYIIGLHDHKLLLIN